MPRAVVSRWPLRPELPRRLDGKPCLLVARVGHGVLECPRCRRGRQPLPGVQQTPQKTPLLAELSAGQEVEACDGPAGLAQLPAR